MARIPVNVEIASEYRYHAPAYRCPTTLIITIFPIRARRRTRLPRYLTPNLLHNGMDASTLSICNVPESALIRQSQLRFLTRAGPEIGVASTKVFFTTQLSSLFVLTLVLAKVRTLVG